MAKTKARQKAQPQESPYEIHPGLAPTADVSSRIDALHAAGLTNPQIAGAIGTSAPPVRDWHQGRSKPRPAARQRLDDLRRVLLILARAGYRGEAAGEWLQSRALPDNQRPIDLIKNKPLEVLAAADEVLFERELTDLDGHRLRVLGAGRKLSESSAPRAAIC